jgi:uncharacterized protein (UPF0332 family)
MKTDALVEKGLLLKTKSNAQEIEGSMAIAERFLEKARGNLKIDYFDVAFSLAYQSMFHSARALLFRKNFKERSHSALISALKELYTNEPRITDILETMDGYRMTRHAVQYSGLGCSKEDAQEAIKDAEKFIEAADKAIAQK